MRRKLKNTAMSFFIIYSIAMIWLLFGQRMDHWAFDSYPERLMSNYNFVPFLTIIEFIKGLNYSSFYIIKALCRILQKIRVGESAFALSVLDCDP